MKLKYIELLTLIILSCIWILSSWIFLFNFNTPWQHFSDQAQSFLSGRLDVNPLMFDQHDYNIKDGKYYWPQGPFPALILMPFQFFLGINFHQGTMQLILIILLIFLLFKLTRLKNFNTLNSFYLISVFLFGSTVSGLIIDPKSWYFAQIVSVTVLTALILELETKRRWLLMGLYEAALIATRPTSGFIIFALLWLIYQEKLPINKKLTKFLNFILPILAGIIALLWFNYARFGNPLNNGYLTNEVGGFIEPLRTFGIFSLAHIPTNFYYYFFASVEPITSNINVHLSFPFIKYNVWGLSFFIVSPFFIYTFNSLKKLSACLKSLWLVIIITLITLLSYYTPGWYQFGPRYTADFMPILYLLLLYSLNPPALTNFQKFFLAISCVFNTYLLISPIILK